MNLDSSFDTKIENTFAFDGPLPYNYDPARSPTDREQTRIRRNNGQ